MSNQSNQKLWRNASPASNKQQGPLRATQQFGLASPSRGLVRRSPTSSPAPGKDLNRIKVRSLSETGLVSGSHSPLSPGFLKADSSKGTSPVRFTPPAKTGSLESLTMPYLSGQWPKDSPHWSPAPREWGHASRDDHFSLSGAFTADKQTQTPEEWDELSERRKKGLVYKRSVSSSGDQLGWIQDMRHKLPRKPTIDGCRSSLQRKSPVPAMFYDYSAPYHSVSNSVPQHSVPIKIPGQQVGIVVLVETPGKARGSIEGLSQEVEKLIISGRRAYDDKLTQDLLDGHKAPTLELLTCSIDTQTPSQSLGDYYMSLNRVEDTSDSPASSFSEASDGDLSATESRSHSISPSMPLILGNMELEDHDPHATENVTPKTQLVPRHGQKPNNEFVREPPDGAEKVKTIDESSPVFRDQVPPPLLLPPTPTPVGTIQLQPSESSAFHSLLKSKVVAKESGLAAISGQV